jgi:hypothetical protein
MHEVDHLMMTAGGSSGRHHTFFDEAKAQTLYATTFPIGPRGGALIPVGNAVTLECWLPYKEPSGFTLPFVPMPFTGREIVHDIGRKKAVAPWQLEACEVGSCRCTSRPTGWRLTRPVVRALLGVTDHALNDWGRLLPGALPGWGLAWDTLGFMAGAYFNPQFILPKREESRKVRAQRTQSRSAGWKHTHPEHIRRRR